MQRKPIPASILVYCGTICIVAALALGWYIVHENAAITAEHSRQLASLMAQAMKEAKQDTSVTLPPTYYETPGPVVGLMWLSAIMGVVLALVGIRVRSSKPQ